MTGVFISMDLVLHADDFGLHPAVNAAIYAAAKKGTLSGASLLANGPAVAEAVVMAHELSDLGIALHLNIVRGRPLSPPSDIPSLVTNEGLFLNSMSRLMLRALTGRLKTEEILREYRLQLAFVVSHGLTPARLDSEKHHHLLFPQAARAMTQLAAESGVNSVRVVAETKLAALLAKQGVLLGAAPFQQRLKLSALEVQGSRLARDFPVTPRPLLTFGVAAFGAAIDERAWMAVLTAILAAPGESVVEWIFHPGYHCTMDKRGFISQFGRIAKARARQDEAAFLISPAVRELCARHREKILTWPQL